jgi:hypothetical protein
MWTKMGKEKVAEFLIHGHQQYQQQLRQLSTAS